MTQIASLTDRLLQAFPSGSFCLPAMLELAAIEETDAVPTAAVECAARPRLLLNPKWIAEHADTPEKLVMLTLHELHHVVLGHTRLYPRAEPLDNLVFDAVINSMLCHMLPDRACTSLMTDFYREDQFPECFLRPPEGWVPGGKVATPKALDRHGRRRLADLYRRLYTPQGVGYDELRDALRPKVDERALATVMLLGDHRSEQHGASSAGQLEIRSPALLQEVRRIVQRWPQPEIPIEGCSLADLLKASTVTPTSPRNTSRLAQLLRRIGGASGRGSLRRVQPQPHLIETPLPMLDRRSAVLRSLGAAPLLHRGTVPARRLAPFGDRVHVYLDVSGSLQQLVSALFGALLAAREWVHPVVHQFSTRVADVTLKQMLDGKCKTTGGTSIECVGEHMQRHAIRRAVLVTDGFVGTPGEATRRVMQRALIGVALTPGNSHRADLQELADHWIDLEI